MHGDASAVAGGGFTSRRPVITADREKPVLAGGVLFQQNGCSDRKVAVRIEQLAWVVVALRLIPDVDLAETGVDAVGREVDECAPQARAGRDARRVALCSSGDVERPGPRDQPAMQAHAALLQGHGKQHG